MRLSFAILVLVFKATLATRPTPPPRGGGLLRNRFRKPKTPAPSPGSLTHVSNILDPNAHPSIAAHTNSHQMSPTTLILNILADLCPHGMLPLSYALASSHMGGPVGGGTAAAILIMFGGLGLYSMVSIARVVENFGSDKTKVDCSLSGAWDDVFSPGRVSASFKHRTVGAVTCDSLCFGLTVGCCLFYSAFIADIYASLARAFALPGILSKVSERSCGRRKYTSCD